MIVGSSECLVGLEVAEGEEGQGVAIIEQPNSMKYYPREGLGGAVDWDLDEISAISLALSHKNLILLAVSRNHGEKSTVYGLDF